MRLANKILKLKLLGFLKMTNSYGLPEEFRLWLLLLLMWLVVLLEVVVLRHSHDWLEREGFLQIFSREGGLGERFWKLSSWPC